MTKVKQDNKEEKELVTVIESAKDETAAQRPANEKPASHKLSLILIIITIVCVLGLSYYFYDLQLQLNKNIQRQQQSITGLQNDIDSAKSGINKSQSGLVSITQQIQQLTEKLEATEAISQQSMEVINRNQRDWMIAEVNYLLRMAHQRIEIARDVNGAIAALKGADSRIAELGDLRMMPIRKQLAEDIGSLSSIHQADINGISLEIDQMLSHIPDLPFKSAEEELRTQLELPEEKPETVVTDTGQTFMDSVLDTVKQIGDIKIHKRSIKTASSANQQVQVEQTLRTYLLSARLAVLRLEQAQFLYEVNSIKALLEKHYDLTDNRIENMQKNLDQYLAIQLRPELPQLTGAWEMLQQQILREQNSESIEAQEKE